MFGLVHAVFVCKVLRPISAQVGDGSNTIRNTPVTVFDSGVASVALGSVRWILTCCRLNLCIFHGKKASVVACLDIHLPTLRCCQKFLCRWIVLLSPPDTHCARSYTVSTETLLCCSDGRSIEMLGNERSWTSTGVWAAWFGIFWCVQCKRFRSGRRQLTDLSLHAYRCCGLEQRSHTHLSRNCTIVFFVQLYDF